MQPSSPDLLLQALSDQAGFASNRPRTEPLTALTPDETRARPNTFVYGVLAIEGVLLSGYLFIAAADRMNEVACFGISSGWSRIACPHRSAELLIYLLPLMAVFGALCLGPRRISRALCLGAAACAIALAMSSVVSLTVLEEERAERRAASHAPLVDRAALGGASAR